MKKVIAILGLTLTTSSVFAGADVTGKSRSTSFDGVPGIVVEISGDSALQLMRKLNVPQDLENHVVTKIGRNVRCLAQYGKETKCIIRFNEDGSAGTWLQQ